MAVHCDPALKVTNTPASVPAYRVCAGRLKVGVEVGSMTSALTGAGGRLARTETKVVAPSVERSRSPGAYPAEVLGPPPNAPMAAYTVFACRGSTASRLTNPGTVARCAQLCPEFWDRQRKETFGHEKLSDSSGRQAV